jgi:hypothetical protein
MEALSRQELEAAHCRALLVDQSTFASVTVEELLDADALPPQAAAALGERYIPWLRTQRHERLDPTGTGAYKSDAGRPGQPAHLRAARTKRGEGPTARVGNVIGRPTSPDLDAAFGAAGGH